MLLDDASSTTSTVLNQPLSQPKFYTLESSAFAGLDQGSQSAVAFGMQQFTDFYHEWESSPDRDPVVWNRRIKEFEEELRLQIGPEAMDRIFH